MRDTYGGLEGKIAWSPVKLVPKVGSSPPKGVSPGGLTVLALHSSLEQVWLWLLTWDGVMLRACVLIASAIRACDSTQRIALRSLLLFLLLFMFPVLLLLLLQSLL